MFNAAPHPLTNFEIQKYQSETKFNGAHSRSNLLKIKDGAYVENLYEYKSIVTHWIALNVNGHNGSGSYNKTYSKRNQIIYSRQKYSKYL